MCEFCLKHGEGKKWYLQAKNYSDDLLRDAQRHSMIEEFFKHPDAATQSVKKISGLAEAPRYVRDFVTYLITRKQKKVHYGQVVPIEDVEKIFEMTNEIVRVACYCRHDILGKEKRFCYGISMSPNGGLGEILRGIDANFLTGPQSQGVERLTKEEALESFRRHEREGLCHTIWTFQTPFIGGICNCDRADCWAMRFTMTHNVPVMFRGEYVGEVDGETCTGCRECVKVCQFGAMMFSVSEKKAAIDQRWCYGCGICRAACKKDAIKLIPREQSPVAAKLW